MLAPVSILVPCYNHKDYVLELLDSIERLRHRDFEVVVVDDGSTDGTRELLESSASRYAYPLTVIFQENHGVARTANRLASLAKHDLIAFIASDDVYLPERFDEQAAQFSSDPRLCISWGNGLAYRDGKAEESVHSGELRSLLLSEDAAGLYHYLTTRVPAFFIQGCTIRKSFFWSLGGFDEGILADDWALNIKSAKALAGGEYSFSYIDRPLFLYRQHSTNANKNLERQFALIDEVVKKYVPMQNLGCFGRDYASFFKRFAKRRKLRMAATVAGRYGFVRLARVLLEERLRSKTACARQ